EAARNLAGLNNAGSTEFGACEHPVVGLMTEWQRGEDTEVRDAGDNMGGTMRLGAYPALLEARTHIAEIYGMNEIAERHRHRYEVNINYREQLEKAGLKFSGTSPDGILPETVELLDHPWFIGVQYHPELKSKPFDPHPLFQSFVAAALDQSRLV
ncbi:MAG: gamma-glutamyl-gamma-aminobutyrate hydrolase family protein, partial [Alphaproteobacteria bacterium]